MNDDILLTVYLLLIFALIFPGFIYANKNKKILFNNLFIWILIIGVIAIIFKLFF
jgi:hypothetical protein